MRIATWNVNGLRARLDYVRMWLEARQPDVVGLQELKVSEEEFPSSAFDDLGYEVVVYGQKAWNGVAILTRHPAEPALRGLPGQEEFGARLVGARGRRADVRHRVLPERQGPRARGLPAQARVVRRPGALLALAGRRGRGGGALRRLQRSCPRRSTPGAARRGRAHSSHTVEERSRLGALLDLGLRDLFREGNPDTRAFSWWDYRAGAFARGHGLRIDFPPRDEAGGRAGHGGGDRPRFPQEEGGPHRLRPRPGHRRPRLEPPLIVPRRAGAADCFRCAEAY